MLGDVSEEPGKPRACSVQVRSGNASPFAIQGRQLRERNHILYREISSIESNESTEVATTPNSETQVTNAFAKLTESLRFPFKSGSAERRLQFRTKCRAFIIDRVMKRQRWQDWDVARDRSSCDFETTEAGGDWTVIDKAPEDDWNFCPVEMEPADLEPLEGFSLSIPAREVQKGRMIGEGAFGHVYKAVYKGKTVVMKEVAPHHYHSDHGERFIDSLKSELRVMGALGPHANVLTCYGGSVAYPNVFMLSELMDMNLADLIYGQPDGPAPLTVELALHITHDILAGLNHLHHMTPRIVHRDVKPENVLLNKRKHACVADFGLSRTKSHSYINTENSHAGTPEYLAPEAAKGKLDEKMDIYSTGVILWECLMAQRPWEGYHPFAIFLSVAQGQRLALPEEVFPSGESDNRGCLPCNLMDEAGCVLGDATARFRIRQIIERCWLASPVERPTCLELLDDVEDVLLELYSYGH